MAPQDSENFDRNFPNLVAPQDSENCGRNFAKRKQSDAVFAGNRLLRIVIIDIIVINTILGRLTLDPAGMHCPAWGDAFGF